MKTIFLTFSLLLISNVLNGQTNSNYLLTNWDAKETKIQSLIAQYEQIDIFSGVVLIAHQGIPLLHQAYGLANRATGEANTTETRFDIGSMNKTFTKTVVLQLIEEGKLSFDDQLDKYLSDFPIETKQITIRQLLDHESGYGDYNSESYHRLPLEEKTIPNLMSIIRKMELQFKPGADQMYSNAGYIILGAVVEIVTNNSYYDEVEKRIIKKLNLENTFIRSKYDIAHRAIGYLKTMRGKLEDNEWLQESPKPDGGFYSTTSDILKFYRTYLYGDQLIEANIRQEDSFSKFVTEVRKNGGFLPFAGGFNGANTVIFEDLKDEISIIVFANMDEPVAEQVGLGIINIMRNKEPQPPTLPAVQWVYQAFKERGINYVEENFEKLTTNFHPTDPKDLILNNIGYNLLFSDQDADIISSIEIFQLNTKLFPEVANTWDSLGEALLKNNKKDQARQAYEQALRLQPGLLSAKKALDQINR